MVTAYRGGDTGGVESVPAAVTLVALHLVGSATPRCLLPRTSLEPTARAPVQMFLASSCSLCSAQTIEQSGGSLSCPFLPKMLLSTRNKLPEPGPEPNGLNNGSTHGRRHACSATWTPSADTCGRLTNANANLFHSAFCTQGPEGGLALFPVGTCRG